MRQYSFYNNITLLAYGTRPCLQIDYILTLLIKSFNGFRIIFFFRYCLTRFIYVTLNVANFVALSVTVAVIWDWVILKVVWREVNISTILLAVSGLGNLLHTNATDFHWDVFKSIQWHVSPKKTALRRWMKFFEASLQFYFHL